MSADGKDYEIGRGRTPAATRWKKGQSGNLAGRPPSRSIGHLEMIDRLLLARVKITINGKPKWMTTLEAILMQLWSKGMANDRRALAVFIRCQDLASQVADRTVQITFADTDYSRAFSGQSFAGTPGDE